MWLHLLQMLIRNVYVYFQTPQQPEPAVPLPPPEAGTSEQSSASASYDVPSTSQHAPSTLQHALVSPQSVLGVSQHDVSAPECAPSTIFSPRKFFLMYLHV